MAKFEAKINYNNYNGQVIRTIEAHTEGEYCRVALDCPDVPGNTMIEKKNYIDAIIGLPANIFYGTSIPTCILVMKKCRK